MQDAARMDVRIPLNCQGTPLAYTTLEQLLAQLEALTGTLPACYNQHSALYQYCPDPGIYFPQKSLWSLTETQHQCMLHNGEGSRKADAKSEN